MPIINEIIPTQGFEIVRNRIADILIDEIENQYNYTLDSDLKISFSIEERITFDKSELTRLNISLFEGDFDNQNAGQGDGTFKYNIDIIGNESSTDDNQGDALAAIKVEKILGKVYAIITNAQYRTLGFKNKGIQRILAGPLSIGEIGQGDARSTMFGRLVLTVKLTQATGLLNGTLAEGYDTQIKIGTSSVGFSYKIDN